MLLSPTTNEVLPLEGLDVDAVIAQVGGFCWLTCWYVSWVRMWLACCVCVCVCVMYRGCLDWG